MLSSWLVVFVWLMAGAPGSNPADVEEVLDRYCVGCICEGASRNCDRQAGCEGGYCGPFRISQPYFQDVQGAPGIGSRSYEECTGEAGCAAAALRAYMGRYSRDCDGDGEVTCTDLAMIHRAGPGGCTNVNMIKQTKFFQRFEECRSNFNIN